MFDASTYFKGCMEAVTTILSSFVLLSGYLCPNLDPHSSTPPCRCKTIKLEALSFLIQCPEYIQTNKLLCKYRKQTRLLSSFTCEEVDKGSLFAEKMHERKK